VGHRSRAGGGTALAAAPDSLSPSPTSADTPEWRLPDRRALAGAARELLQRGAGRKPDVVLVRSGGRAFVVKDFSARAPWLRATLGRWLVSRELRAYRALAGHPDVPRLLGRLDAYGFVLEHRPGRRLSRQRAAALPPDFLARLERAVREMHGRGVVHLDLRHRSNVLVDESGAPVLIDFASALRLRPDRWPERLLLRWLARVDERALRKWRAKLAQPGAGGAGGAGGSSDGGRGASLPR
jgi:hypothetical protein